MSILVDLCRFWLSLSILFDIKEMSGGNLLLANVAAFCMFCVAFIFLFGLSKGLIPFLRDVAKEKAQ